MSSEFGKNIKVSVFGESHGDAVGVVIDGLPAGEKIDNERLIRFMRRRKPGKDKISTQRKESDIPLFLSGIKEGKTCGSPVAAVIKNTDTRPSDYEEIKYRPRPGHADYTAFVKWDGASDHRGGGHFSGRLTAPLCAAGGIAIQILERRGIHIGAHISEIYSIKDDSFPLDPQADMFEAIAEKSFPVINDISGGLMIQEIKKAADECDSLGGVIECAVTGIPAGKGSPMFDGVESIIASAIFGIPAVKGIEFGAGFGAAHMRGSENNDAFYMDKGIVRTKTNNSGGILGGITDGMPVIFRVAVKPTPSIGKEQETVDLIKKQNDSIKISGRHDPCIVPRAVPVIEAVTAIVVLDLILEG